MSHIITAVILKGDYDPEAAQNYDLIAVDLGFELTLFFIDENFTGYWEKKLNIRGELESNNSLAIKRVIYELLKRISRTSPVEFAAISTAYVGGMGDQYANVYLDDQNVDSDMNSINLALAHLGVVREGEEDEFDTVGLGRFRKNPDYLDKYERLL